MRIKSSERGQAVVVLVLAIVGMLGFVALAVDGGTIYVERRRSQSAADAAAFAAALSGANGEDWSAAGLQQANLNGFDNDGVQDIVEVYNPPVSGPYSGDSEYYQVIITSTSMPVFSQVIFSDGLTGTVEAVTRISPGIPVSTGNALFSTSMDRCEAMVFSGNGTVLIDGGNIFTNSSADSKNCFAEVVQNTAADITITNGGMYAVGGIEIHDNASVISTNGIYAGAIESSVPVPPTPDCSDLTGGLTCSNCSGDISPGIYPSGISNLNSSQVWNPGLYCLQDDLMINGGSIVAQGVMIYIQAGEVTILGGDNDLRAESAEGILVDGSGNDWQGMLLYMDTLNTGEVKISGSSDTYLFGTIYAIEPTANANKAKCVFTGSSGTFSMDAQIICDTIEVTGSGAVNINYDGTYELDTATNFELVQ